MGHTIPVPVATQRTPDAPAATAEKPRSLRRTIAAAPAAAFLIVLMAIGSVILWLGIPIGWLYLASQLVDTSQPTLGPYILIIFGIPITMFVFGKALFTLDRAFERVTGRKSETDFRPPWLKSMRGERTTSRQLTVLEGVMIVSVSLALLCFGIWFFLFAGSSLPT
jgi:hypothetical protein